MTRLVTEAEKGVYVIAATPFQDDGKVDFESIDRLVDFYLQTGVSGMTVLGMMGEANKLSEEESRLVMKRFLRRIDGKVPLIVGVSNPGSMPSNTFYRWNVSHQGKHHRRPPEEGGRTL